MVTVDEAIRGRGGGPGKFFTFYRTLSSSRACLSKRSNS